ncbi:MAG: ComEA family DNA-binding protein [Fidelibacterota bacterium]
MLCVSPLVLKGQELDDVLSLLQSEEEGDLLGDDELIRLELLMRNPLDLNRVDATELEGIPLVTSPDAALIIRARDSQGGFQSVDEAREIAGLSVVTARLLPLVTTVTPGISGHFTLRNRWSAYNNDARILTQGEFERSDLSWGFTLERDPGEPSLSDYVSGHMVFKAGEQTAVFMGDHQVIAGYGLLFGPTTRPFKTPTGLTRFARLGKGLRPHRSTRERWALRGVAVDRTEKKNRLWVSLSVSPRTNDENRKKGPATETVAAMTWERTTRENGRYGLLLAYDRWTLPGSSHDPRAPRTYGSFSGRIPLDDVDLFGEIATHTGTPPAMTAGLIMVEKNLRWVLTVRRYPMGFHGPRSQPFREFSSERLNESGVYQGMSLRWGNHRFLTHGDLYRRSPAPGVASGVVHGFEAIAQWTLHLRNRQLSFRWKGEKKTLQDRLIFPGEAVQKPFRKESWRFHGILFPRRSFQFQMQFDRSDVSDDGDRSRGYGVSLKVRYSRTPWRVTWNWTGFRVEESDARITIWDLNLPAELRIKTFSGTGHSMALLAGVATPAGARVSIRMRSTWKLSPQQTVWMKARLEGGLQMDIAL